MHFQMRRNAGAVRAPATTASNMDEAAGFDPRSTIARTVLLTRASASSLHDRQRRGLIVDVELPVRQSRQSAACLVQAASESGWASS
jgi:hypothetical protein